MNSKTDKKQLLIFLIVAYGVTFLMGFIMWYGRSKHLDLTAFVNTQMMYPAAGVMLAYKKKKEKKSSSDRRAGRKIDLPRHQCFRGRRCVRRQGPGKDGFRKIQEHARNDGVQQEQKFIQHQSGQEAEKGGTFKKRHHRGRVYGYHRTLSGGL